MTTGRAFHRAEDGTETDITEGVQALYDLVISSMNWGSGFWSWEDALPVAQVGHLLGFAEIEEVDRYVADRKHEEERQRWINEHPEAHRRVNPASVFTGLGTSVADLLGHEAVPHEHVLSSVGRCMWPRCSHQEERQLPETPITNR